MKTITRILDTDLQTDFGLIRAGSEVEFHENGKVASFIIENNTLIYGFLFKAGTKINLYNSGKFNSGTLARIEKTTINTYDFEFAADKELAFWENGSIATGVMTKNVRFNEPYNLEIKSGFISFDTYGRLFYGTLNSDLEISNSANPLGAFIASLRPNSVIQFHLDVDGTETPSILHAFLAKELKWNGFEMDANSGIGFYKGTSVLNPGSIHSLIMRYDTYRDNFLIKAGQVIIYLNGKLKDFYLQKEKLINNIRVPKDSKIGLFQSGKLESLECPVDIVINGSTYPAKTPIRFNESGDVVSPL